MLNIMLGIDSKKMNIETNIEYEKFAVKKKFLQSKTSLRLVAFLAVVFSTFAISACLFAFPFIFHNVQQLQAHIQVNLAVYIIKFCKAFKKILN